MDNERAREKARQRSQKWRDAHPGYTTEYIRRVRDKVLTAYGDRCACCGETRREFLSIDHINGGRAHQRSLGMQGKGSNFLTWIVRNDFPDILQILCHNCNMAKGAYGQCPHTIH